MMMSSGVMAITCRPTFAPETSITLDQKVDNLVVGQYLSPELNLVFAGTVDDEPITKSYQLVDQNGEAYTFKINDFLISTPFCRTRVCDSEPRTARLIGKLTLPSGESEYFNCL